jgi:hypothetical protein
MPNELDVQAAQDEFFDLLARFVGMVREDDFLDPQFAALTNQMISILEPRPEPIPLSVVDQLKDIQNKVELFRKAAKILAVSNPEALKKLLDSLKALGLMKKEQ